MVNVKDFSDYDVPAGDMLINMFERQEDLMQRYVEIESCTLPCIVPHKTPVDLNSYEGQHQIKERIFNTMIELAEAADCMKNKSWKQTMIETDVIHLVEEIVDALHFFIEVCILIGIPANDLFRYYMKKSEVNKFRQESRY